MFCPNCGKELKDGEICNCAENPAVEENKEDVVKETPVEETPVEETPVEETPAEETPEEKAPEAVFEQPVEAPRKSNKKKIIALVIAAAVIVALVAVISAAKGFFIKTFGSSEAYLSYVAENFIEENSEKVSEAYGEYKETLSLDRYGAKGAFTIEVGDTVVALLEAAIESELDVDISLDGLNKIVLSTDVTCEKDKMQGEVALYAGDSELAEVVYILDSNAVYLSIPTVSDKYISFELETEELGGYYAGLSAVTAVTEQIAEAAPSEDLVNDTLVKYLKIVINTVKDVKKTSETVTVGEISEKFTKLTVRIDENDFNKIGAALARELVKDEDLKKAAKELYEAVAGTYVDVEDEEYSFDSLWQNIVDAANGYADYVDEHYGEYSGEAIEIALLINSKHAIAGIEFAFDEEPIFVIHKAVDGKNVGEEFVAYSDGDEIFKISGEGTEKGDCINRAYTVSYESKKLLSVEFIDVYLEKNKGTIKASPKAGLFAMLGGDEFSSESLLASSVSVEVSYDFEDSDENSFRLSVSSGGELIAAIGAEASMTNGKKITVPSEEDMFDVDDAKDWLKTFDFHKLIENVEAMNISKDLKSIIVNALELAELYLAMA